MSAWIESEIVEQPGLLARTLERCGDDATLETYRGTRLHLVGCGDMAFASEAAAWLARCRGQSDVQAHFSMSMRWLKDQLSTDAHVVCGSISGRTPRTIEAARAARASGARVLALTDNVDSVLAEAASDVFDLQTSPREALGQGEYPGYHHQVPQTKTFLVTLLTQCALVSEEREEWRLSALPEHVAQVLRGAPSAVEASTEVLEDRRRVIVLGSGPFLPIAKYWSAKLKEYAIDSQAQCVEEYNHLEMFQADEGTLVLVLAPDGPSRRRADELSEAWTPLGAKTALIDPREWVGSAPDLLTSVFGLAVTGQLWAVAAAKRLGRDLDLWLGGERTELMNTVSQIAIRGSKIE
ncbi:MAG: SIS domain-containing protein [Planctomycetota bacterium]